MLFLLSFISLSLFGQGFGVKEQINKGWKFHFGDLKYGGVEFHDDSAWRVVNLPHDWSVEQTPSPSNASCTGFLPGGMGWYRKDLDISKDKKGEKVYIYFEGVYNNSEVYINGKWIGRRPNGYVSFCYDLTPYINFGGRNVIAVSVDHTDDADSRWYTGSGIYRDVYLVFANPVHINLWGVSYDTEVGAKASKLNLSTEINNTNTEESSVVLKYALYDSDDKLVAKKSISSKGLKSGVTKLATNLSVKTPKLWSIESPYLYKLKTEVFSGGKIVDQTETSVGFRTIEFDANSGFALNGKDIKLKGVCLHHDAGCLGSAVPKEIWVRRIQQLKAIGCNAIRMSHNPQATSLYEVCDEQGMVVMDEAFDEWEYPKKKWIEGWNVGTPGFQGSSHYFREWSGRDLRDMIRRNRNHPSIILWSIGNEVDYPNDPYSHPILDNESISQQHTAGYQKNQPNANRIAEIAQELVDVVKSIDTSRPVTAALAGAVMSNETDFPSILDVVGYNYTEYRYNEDHKKYPNRILYGSETRHDLDAWKAVRDNKFIFGQFLWTGYDYLGESGTWPSRGFTTGLIDLAGNIKPSGHFRKALWLEEPTVYIGTYLKPSDNNYLSTYAPKIWNYKNSEVVRVVAYTNCESVELYLNEQMIGERKNYDDNTAIVYWDIPYVDGVLSIRGYNDNKMVANDKITTSSYPYKIVASLDKTSVDGADKLVHLTIEVQDEFGVLVPFADNEITCVIKGDGELLGLESASVNVSDNYKDNIQRCNGGRLLGYIRTTADVGFVEIELTSPLLKESNLKVVID